MKNVVLQGIDSATIINEHGVPLLEVRSLGTFVIVIDSLTGHQVYLDNERVEALIEALRSFRMTNKVTTSTTYSPATQDSELAAILAENLAGDSLSLGDMPRVSVPAGGGSTWELPTADGFENVKEISGVIVHQQIMRGYFESNIAAKGTPPACYSNDGVWGLGEPGGECAKCPLNQFGPNREAKACKEKKALFIVRKDDPMPLLLRVPPGSLGALRSYMAGLATQSRRAFYTVETRIGLEKATSGQGIAFSKVSFSKVRDLDPNEAAYIKDVMRPRVQALAGAIDAQQETMDE